MIKVIAADLDGTLLDEKHKLNEVTYRAMMKAYDAGIKLIIITGRNFGAAKQGIDPYVVPCDYIIGSGAEIRTSKGEVLLKSPISYEKCSHIYEVFNDYQLDITFSGAEMDYQIGTEEDVIRTMVHSVQAMVPELTMEDILSDPAFNKMCTNTHGVERIDYFIDNNIPIYKILCFHENVRLLKEIGNIIEKKVHGIAVASSFSNILEITDILAQKGPVLQKYIESLGCSMDEIMVLGDSMNDYSMLCMDFGATVAMDNGDDEIKKIAKYITKANTQDGAAYAIEAAIENNLMILRRFVY